jgi:hypothetical protein
MTTKPEQAYVLPTWSKLLIGVVVLALAGTFALGLAVIFEVKKMGVKMKDPKAIAAAAKKIGAFPEPLPSGFQYKIGIDLDPLESAMVAVEHEPDKQLLIFSRIPGNIDGKELLDYGYQAGPNMVVVTAKFIDLEKRGSLKIGSYEIPYMIGHVEDMTRERGEGFVGALQVGKNPTKNILIYAFQTGKVPYNQQITMDLLNSIKSF